MYSRFLTSGIQDGGEWRFVVSSKVQMSVVDINYINQLCYTDATFAESFYRALAYVRLAALTPQRSEFILLSTFLAPWCDSR